MTKSPAARHTQHLRLSYADCDPAGIVYYATWFPWMERTHTEFWFLHGLRFDTLMETHGALPVTRRTTCEYLTPVRVFDVLRCEMRTGRVGRTSYEMGFTFVREPDGAVAARSTLTLVAVDASGEPVPVPAALRAHLT